MKYFVYEFIDIVSLDSSIVLLTTVPSSQCSLKRSLPHYYWFFALFLQKSHGKNSALAPSSSLVFWLKIMENYQRNSSVQFSSVTQSCLTVCDPMNCNTPGFPVHHLLPELVQTYVHWAGDAIQPSHPLSSPSPPALNLSQHQGLFQWVSFSNQVAKLLEFQLQHQSFQWIFRTCAV